MRYVCLFVLVFVEWLNGAEAGKQGSSYIIAAPNVFRAGQMFNVQVTILNTTAPVNVTAGIIDRYKNLVASSTGQFHPGTSRELLIKVPSVVGCGYACWFFAKGSSSGGLRFYKQAYLQFKRKQMSIYVQTDKGIYKPGQTVHMRIFALFLNLTSYTGKMTVSLVDPNRDKMAHWANVQGPNGIVKKDFTLSTQTVMGKWRIHVKASSESFYQEFEVNKYVLPKFEVSVTLPPYVLKKDTKLLGHVTSKYTYGKGVRGTVEIQVYFSQRRRSIKQQLNLDETASFSFDMQEIQDLFHSTYTWARKDYLYHYRYRLHINATVTDKLTGKTAYKEQSVTFHLTDVKLEFPSFNPSNFKPGLPLVVLLKITKPNGVPHHPDFLRSMTIFTNIKFHWRDNATIREHHPTPDGIVVFTEDIPSNVHVVNIKAEYRNGSRSISQAWFSASKLLSQSNDFIQLFTSTPSVTSGERIDCHVTSNFPMSTCMYMVLSRGSIRHTGHCKVQDNAYNATFQLTSQPIMSPSARIVVYSLTNRSEIVVDSLTISIDNPFKNKVSLEFSNDTLRPGDQVKLVAKATPGSHVAFLAIDKSVLLLKKDNDISYNQVLRDLQSYSTGSAWYSWWEWGWHVRCGLSFYTRGIDAYSIFKNSGLIVFSDGLIYKKLWRFDRRFNSEVPGIRNQEESEVAARRRSSPGSSAIKVRSFFPETWLWVDVNSSSTGKAEISATVPDTMTSWIASAFAISPTTGFGISAIKPKLKVFQPFFISLDLPYSVIRGEEVAIKVLLFNYLEEDKQVTVTFKASKYWSSINDVSVRGLHSQQAVDIVELVTVPAGQGKDIAFPIIPKTLGIIPLTVYAKSSLASDAVRRTLLVEPEGIPQQYSYSLLIDLNTTSSFTKTLELSLPKSVVDGSAHAKVTLIGDILGSSFNNIDDLLRMPYGCGEQNMINFAPNIFILKYLTAVNRVTSHIKQKSEKYMMQGYQREQTYRHKDGSYSAFGERDKEGSMWLTAFVVKSFAQARKYIYIDESSLDSSLRWIVQKQNKNGSFPRVGYVHSSYLKGGLKGELPLTAYVAIALSEAQSPSELVNLAKYLAIRYLESNLHSVITSKDVYSLAVTTYALKLENSASSDKALRALLASGIRKGTTLYWSNTKQNVDKSSEFHPYYRPRSADIEITAYALLTLALSKDFRNGLPVVRWLSQQRNSLGGYSSTQDTVLGIQAMSEFAALIYSPKFTFQLTLTHSAASNFNKTFTVDSNNAMVLQQVLIPKVKGKLKVTAIGHGIGLLQVGVTYHVTKAPVHSNFDIYVKILKEANNYVEAQACARWKGAGEASTMAVVEMGVMSGFTTDEERVNELLDDKSLALKRVDFQEKRLIFYFDQIKKGNASCIPVRFERRHAVGKGKPVPAVVYDYYSPENRAEALYSSKKDVDVCQVCSSCVGCNIKNSSKPPNNNIDTTAIPNNHSYFPACTSCKNVTHPNESESRKNSSPGFTVGMAMTSFNLIIYLMLLSSIF